MPRSRSDLAQSPLRLARKHLGLSISDFAQVCQVHEQALYLNECGCYSSVLPSVEAVLSGLGFDTETLEREYRNFQLGIRQDFGRVHNFSTLRVSELGRHRLDRSPVTVFRDRLGVSQLGFAKSLCVQPAILYKCEKGRAAGVPEQLERALKDAQFPVELVHEIDERQKEFYDFLGQSDVA